MAESFSITEYAGDPNLLEIPCIFKRLYSDFVVVEIPSVNNVLKPGKCDENVDDTEGKGTKRVLEDTEATDDCGIKKPKLEAGQASDGINTTVQETGAKPFFLTDEDAAIIDDVFNEKIGEHMVDVSSVEKEVRKGAYEYVNHKYGVKIVINTVDGKMCFKRRSKDAPFDSRELLRNRCPRGHSLYFTMTKRNKDTSFAINSLSKLLNIKPERFSFAGNKDRRAITTQLVCVTFMSKEQLSGIRRKLLHDNIWINDLHYRSDSKLQLGDLWGNHFEVVLREFNDAITKEELANRINNWLDVGFINYFGHQRFGACGVDTSDIGRHILSGHWEKAVELILSKRLDDNAHGCLGIALKIYHETKDAEKALKFIKAARSSMIELLVLKALAKDKQNFKGAILGLSRDMRSLYVHAYQSRVFNQLASRRARSFGLKVIEGDIDGSGKPFESIKNASIEDVHMPLPSLSGSYLDNEIGKWCKEIIEADGLSEESFRELERSFVIGDVRRPFIVKPLNVDWEIIRYDDSHAALQTSLFIDENKREPLKGSPDNGKYSALRIKFDLPACSYATVALRELLHTDLSKVTQKSKELERSARKTKNGADKG